MSTVCVDPDDFQTDGAGRLQIKKGCGLKGSDDGVAVNVSEWPYECGVESGEDLYCDPLTGLLKTRPRPHMDCVDVSAFNGDNIALDAGDTRIITAEVVIDTSDWCGTDSICFAVSIGGRWLVDMAAGASWQVDVEESIDGAAFTSQFISVAGEKNSPNIDEVRGQFFGPRVLNITPGAFNYKARVKVLNTGTVPFSVLSQGARVVGTFQTSNP